MWPWWVRWLLWPLEQLYRAFLWARGLAYRRGWLPTRRLPVKVISVGNLTVGGTGKTPMVMRLAAWLRGRGLHVAVLTRGYGRRETTPLVMNGQGEVNHYKPELMGDEPILIARRLPDVTIGIGADRFALGQRILQMEAEHPPEVFLLDDGFQHLRLARDLDLVLLDATHPIAAGAVLPAGLLREPVAALARADVVVLTRTNGSNVVELTELVGRYNPHAPVFRVSTRLGGVFEAGTHRPAEATTLRQQRVLAFCGVGNPDAFFDDLRRWGFEVVEAVALPDHHRYTISDFTALVQRADRAGAGVFLTTEKDRVNFTVVPPSAPPCFYCQVELAFDDEAGFFDAVAKRLQSATS
jgi:tetraacyldisaccharide 4'-kinase